MAHGRTEKRNLQEWLLQVVQVFSAFINDTDIDDTELTQNPHQKIRSYQNPLMHHWWRMPLKKN